MMIRNKLFDSELKQLSCLNLLFISNYSIVLFRARKITIVIGHKVDFQSSKKDLDDRRCIGLFKFRLTPKMCHKRSQTQNKISLYLILNMKYTY